MSELERIATVFDALQRVGVDSQVFVGGSNGNLKLDKGKIAAEAKLDGQYLIRTNDQHLSVQEDCLRNTSRHGKNRHDDR